MHVKSNAIILLMIASTSFVPSFAQFNLPRYEVSAGPAIFIYQGDLTPAFAGSYRTMRPGFAISGTRIINSFFAARLGFQLASLRGNDASYSEPEWRKQRNFNFSTPVAEISVAAVYNIAGTNGNNEDRILSPYIFGGIGYSFVRISRDWSGFNTDYFGAESWVNEGLANDINHSTPRGLLVLPVGIGVRYPLTSSLSIAAESNYRFTFSDYLDGFSESAGPTKKDYYHSHQLSVIYTFKGYQGIKCPVVRL